MHRFLRNFQNGSGKKMVRHRFHPRQRFPLSSYESNNSTPISRKVNSAKKKELTGLSQIVLLHMIHNNRKLQSRQISLRTKILLNSI
jgi:hypothetical protein